jgi:hypothetical protein
VFSHQSIATSLRIIGFTLPYCFKNVVHIYEGRGGPEIEAATTQMVGVALIDDWIFEYIYIYILDTLPMIKRSEYVKIEADRSILILLSPLQSKSLMSGN